MESSTTRQTSLLAKNASLGRRARAHSTARRDGVGVETRRRPALVQPRDRPRLAARRLFPVGDSPRSGDARARQPRRRSPRRWTSEATRARARRPAPPLRPDSLRTRGRARVVRPRRRRVRPGPPGRARGRRRTRGAPRRSPWRAREPPRRGRGVLLEEGASLADHCTLGVGGPARFLVEVRTPEALAAVLRRAARERLPCVVIGKGSNILFHDGGLRGSSSSTAPIS